PHVELHVPRRLARGILNAEAKRVRPPRVLGLDATVPNHAPTSTERNRGGTVIRTFERHAAAFGIVARERRAVQRGQFDFASGGFRETSRMDHVAIESVA